MKIRKIMTIVFLAAFAVTACKPGSAPEGSSQASDPIWDKIESSGKIVFGTSADYAPFESYDANYEIVGFDIALAREIGARLGLQVEFKDFAFDGLLTAVHFGQIDAAIAAISVSSERKAMVDFTNIYFTGQDLALAKDGSGIETLISAVQFAQYRVGVERGSIYEHWLQTALVDTGLMPASNLLVYQKAEHAVRDLELGSNDVVVMDAFPAKAYLQEDGLIEVAQGLNAELYAIALPKGSSTLQTKLNNALVEIQNDGTLATLSNQYLNIDSNTYVPVPTPTPVTGPVPTLIPAPTTVPGGCYDSMSFVADISIPDSTILKAREDFDKVWRIRNTGTCVWDKTYQIVFIQGSRMDGSTERVKSTVHSGEVYDMVIDQRAPSNPGNYVGIWQMEDRNRTPFGERITVSITVPGLPNPTKVPPKPTAVSPQPTSPPAVQPTTPPIPAQPTVPPPPVIGMFESSVSELSPGNNLEISWSFSGQDLATSRLVRTNPDGSLTQMYGGADVDLSGSYDDLLFELGQYVYTLSVSSEFGGTTVGTVTVNVK